MDKDKIIEIAKDVKNKSNQDLLDAQKSLLDEFNNTKELIVNLTRHMETVEEYYNKINKEIGKRIK